MKKLILIVLLFPTVSEAQYRTKRSRVQYVYTRTTYSVAYQHGAADEGSFCSWLNGIRARHGLAPVGYDPNLAGWAATNNSHQVARGMGHFVMGIARRQNSGVGHISTVSSMWLSSPAHASALLDPSITMVGIAINGSYITFNAY